VNAGDRRLLLDPHPDDTIASLWTRLPKTADAIEDALDWIESDPPEPRAKRRRFSNGMWATTVFAEGSQWLIIWEEPEPSRPVVRHIGESTSL
jgi:hypothetical protein